MLSEGVSPSTRIVRSIISEATGYFNCYISRRNVLFIFIDSFLSIIIICAISSISIVDTFFVSILLLVSVLFLTPSKAKANYKGSNLRKIGN